MLSDLKLCRCIIREIIKVPDSWLLSTGLMNGETRFETGDFEGRNKWTDFVFCLFAQQRLRIVCHRRTYRRHILLMV